MRIDLFGDRDTELLVYGISDVSKAVTSQRVQFSAAGSPENVVTAPIVDQPTEGSNFCSAVPVSKLPRGLCPVTVTCFESDDSSSLSIEAELLICKSMPSAAPVASL